jgi:hypothetical protein
VAVSKAVDLSGVNPEEAIEYDAVVAPDPLMSRPNSWLASLPSTRTVTGLR